MPEARDERLRTYRSGPCARCIDKDNAALRLWVLHFAPREMKSGGPHLHSSADCASQEEQVVQEILRSVVCGKSRGGLHIWQR